MLPRSRDPRLRIENFGTDFTFFDPLEDPMSEANNDFHRTNIGYQAMLVVCILCASTGNAIRVRYGTKRAANELRGREDGHTSC